MYNASQYASISAENNLMDVKSYLSGYVDGEGCFCISINKSSRHSFGWEIRPSFSVSQNSGRKEVLEIMKDYFNCGNIRPDRSDKTLKFEVRSLNDLVKKIIPHFEEVPLISSKQKDFKNFARACKLMSKGAHLTKHGFNQVVDLAFKMNPSGKRKYFQVEIKI